MERDSPVSLQELVGAAERLRRRKAEGPGARFDWLAAVEDARDRLAVHPFPVAPVPAFTLMQNGKGRMVASPVASERLIEEALAPILLRAFEGCWRESVHGYRSGRSTFTAAKAASESLAAGRRHVALLDVCDFYGSINREVLHSRLSERLSQRVVETVYALMSAPLLSDGQHIDLPRGLVLGRPLSPFLANLYMTPVDDAMMACAATYLRYADDVFLAAASVDQRNDAEQHFVTSLAGLGLSLQVVKTKRFEYDGAPFVYLGHAIDHKRVFERVKPVRLARITDQHTRNAAPPCEASDTPLPQPNKRSRTLYLTEPGVFLSIRGGLVVVRKGKDTLREIPLHRIDRVLLLGGSSMTSGFVSACISADIPVLFFVARGKTFGSLVAGGMLNPLRLRAQYDLIGRSDRRMALARAIVLAKIDAMIRRLINVDEAAAIRQRLNDLRRRLDVAVSPASFRGFEGSATRDYYEGFAMRIKESAFRFTQRTRRPPKDRINSLLSFSYSLLFGEMQTALLREGLDPYPGLLHDLRPKHPALASDLVEPYRVLIADSFVLSLVNTRQIGEADFEHHSRGAVYMTAVGRRTFLEAYEAYMSRPPSRGKSWATPRRLLETAARAMLDVVLGEQADLHLPLQVEEDPQSFESTHT